MLLEIQHCAQSVCAKVSPIFNNHCCGYDDYDDDDYDDYWDFPPGDTALCTECLCKGMYKFKKFCTSDEKTNISREFAV